MGCAGAQQQRDADLQSFRGDLKELAEGQKAQVQLIESLRDRLALVEDRLEASALQSRLPARLPVVKVDPPARRGPRYEPSPITIRQEDLDAMGGPRRSSRRAPVPPPANAGRAQNIGVKPISNLASGRPKEKRQVDESRQALADKPMPAFKSAKRLFERREYSAALPLLTRFVRLWPNHEFTDNALYMAGRIRFERVEYGSALQIFQRILHEHPTGNRMPDALLMMGLTFDRMGQTRRGEATLSRLTAMYPQTEAGRQSALELQKIEMRR